MSEDFTEQTERVLRRARSRLEDIRGNLRSARRVVRAARSRERTGIREELSRISDYIESLERLVRDDIQAALPENATDARWNERVREIRTALNNLRGGCGILVTEIGRLIEEGRMGAIAAARRRAGRGIGASPRP